MFEASLYSTFLQKRVTCRCLDNSNPDRYQMTSYCACDLHFSDDEWLWASFHGPVCHLYVFFWKNVYSGCYDHKSRRPRPPRAAPSQQADLSSCLGVIPPPACSRLIKEARIRKPRLLQRQGQNGMHRVPRSETTNPDDTSPTVHACTITLRGKWVNKWRETSNGNKRLIK